MSIQPKESSAGIKETRETVVLKQAKDMLDKLPADFNVNDVKNR